MKCKFFSSQIMHKLDFPWKQRDYAVQYLPFSLTHCELKCNATLFINKFTKCIPLLKRHLDFIIWSTISIHLQNLAVNIYLFKITAPIPAWLLLKIERCFDNFRKSSTSCCFWPFGFGKWKIFASVFSSGAESKSNPSHRSSNSVSKSKIIHIYSLCYTHNTQATAHSTFIQPSANLMI